ncbi:bile acid:sodium symporter family protein [Rhodohalobacter sulfatireducens]|uniref:Bile acid:sodium symporter family protein n=1 Tax=Rhodohalobacter sulfatireducens TaxID=2911366 RepID=A0ABS9KDZ1_9BACT|nr:bile acid:sodium symporter family protein [Rhodohalobacter sulfatireducens]MCG2589027.1 bile acid:sodium symporter family protein [Rhodohalobacter sulfatireducens]
MKTALKAFLWLSLICLIGLIVMLFVDSSSPFVAIFSTGMFLSLAIGVRGTDTIFKSFAFSLWIFSAVTFSMFYPQYMTSWGGYDLSNLIVPLIQLIMFGMGTQLSIQDFKGVFKKPKGVAVGVICQYTIMPIVGISLALSFGFPAEVAAGVVLIGSCPGGVASNVMAFIAKADLALSITLTAVSTMLSPLATPYLMQLLAGQFVPIDTYGMMLSILNMIIAPIVLGLLFNHFLHGKIKWLDDIMPAVSMAGIAFIIAVITAAGRDSLITIGLLLILAAIIHNALGYLFGYWGCRLVGMDEKSCRTIAFEVGMQNGGMASGLAQEMGRLATVGLAPAIFGPWMNISGSTLANYWRRKSEKEEDAGEAPEPAMKPAT